MILASAVYSDRIKTAKQIEFGGLNHNLGAGDGQLWDMKNLTGDYNPLLATRQKRVHVQDLSSPGGLFSWNGLAWVDGDGFYYKGEKKGTVSAGVKTFSSLGAYIVIFPDKAYYNTLTDEFGSMESKWSGTSLTFTNGKLYEEDAEANCIQASGVNWDDYFKAGDAVTIDGCTTHPENNKTPIIREIDGDKLYFYEYIFTLDGEDGTEPYTETGTLSISRTVPDLLYLCENENRLWGCDESTIYACKLGDIFNWNVFDGVATDSYAVTTGSAGPFTACVSYLGYPVFFKEDNIYKVYGDKPSNFQVMGSATMGVAQGSSKSLAVANEILFYLSNAGIMAYSGGIPQFAGEAFGTLRFKNAVAGSDGLKYYVSMQDTQGNFKLYVYDVSLGYWHIEDSTKAISFASYRGDLYFLDSDGGLWITTPSKNPQDGQTAEADFSWMAEFSDFTDEDPNKKGVTKFIIRLELEDGAYVNVFIQYDSDGVWEKVNGALGEGAKRSYYLPVIPRRADHYRIKFEGSGGCRVYSFARQAYSGSPLKSMKGRN